MSDAVDAGHKIIVRLVRYAASRSAVFMEPGEGGVTLCCGKDRPPRHFPQGALDRACALGLVVCDGNRVRATSEAQAFLRRALLAPEDAFQEQHRDTESRSVSVDGIRQTARVNALESPLGAIARLKEKSGRAFLAPEALAAGERLHAISPGRNCSRA